MSGLRIGDHLITKDIVFNLLFEKACELEIIYTDHLTDDIVENLISQKKLHCSAQQKKHLKIFVFEQCDFLLSADYFQKTGKRRYIWKDRQIETKTEITQLSLPFGEQTLFHGELSEVFSEGTAYLASATIYERDPKARESCLKIHGYDCAVCGFNFERAFGPIGHNFIHVHHVSPINLGERKTNPDNDLRPVCPNCHAMLHRNNPPFSIEELKQKLQAK